MTGKNRVLVADDDLDIGFLLKKFLEKKGLEVTHVNSGDKALKEFENKNYDLVLLDFRLGDMEGSDLLKAFKEKKPDVPVVIITGYSDIKTAVKVMKLGAMDYITKPLLPDELWHIVNKGISAKTKPEEKSAAISPRQKSSSGLTINGNGNETYIKGESRLAGELFKQVELVAPTDFSVIILGESGTGKEAIARTIHENSKRKDAPFVAMDCGAISKDLAGSELFGHEKGSFTGALKSKTGHFELANGGTLFLDEIGNLTFEVQMALLRVVQERKLKRIGGTKEIDLDIRILIATNEDLKKLVNEGNFREDLYHRFNEFSLLVPPLRDRGNDIMLFAYHFLEQVNKDLNKGLKGFDEDVIEIFKHYEWPGNLRELKNVIKRAVLLTDKDLIKPKALPVEISNPQKFNFGDDKNYTSNSAPQQNQDHLKNAAREAEYEAIMKVLRSVNFNKTKAAIILNIDRKTLYNKLKQFES